MVRGGLDLWFWLRRLGFGLGRGTNSLVDRYVGMGDFLGRSLVAFAACCFEFVDVLAPTSNNVGGKMSNVLVRMLFDLVDSNASFGGLDA